MTTNDELIAIYDEMTQGVRDTHKSDWEDIAESLATALRAADRRIAELEREWDFAMNGADRLRERLAIAKDGTDKAIELIHRWGCECEPQIGFFCGPCRAVELIDDAMSAERGE